MKIALIDLENVGRIERTPSLASFQKLVVVAGAHQKKFDIPAGLSVDLLQIKKTAKNNADFHIALRLGELAQRYPKASFAIISSDKGFDGICDHMRALGRSVSRLEPIREATLLTQAELRLQRAAAKPRTRKRLLNWLASQLAISVETAKNVLTQLLCRGDIALSGDAVHYHLGK